MSFPSNAEEKQKDETLRNVLLNSLSIYQVKSRKEVFEVQKIAINILNGGDSFELTEEDITLLSRVLYQATIKQDEDEQAPGIYTSIVTSQALKALNITE